MSATQTTFWMTSHGMVATDKPLRERPKDDFYPTPDALCTAAIEQVLCGSWRGRILDPGCGAGPWGRAARRAYPDAEIVGVELTAERVQSALNDGLLDAYSAVLPRDFLDPALTFAEGFDLVVGNPPYSLAESFVMRSLELLRPGGLVLFLLRTAFLESQGRYARMFSGMARPAAVYSLVERPSFTGNGKTDATAYSLFLWSHDYVMRQGANCPTSLYWLSWRTAEESQP